MSSLLQAWMPWNHVWSNFESPRSPQFLNQAPPEAQQLSLPDFSRVPHLGHAPSMAIFEVLVAVVLAVGASGVGVPVAVGASKDT